MLFPLIAFAEDATGAHGATSLIGPAVGFGIGMAVLGGAIGQGLIGSAFMHGAARNPNAVNSMKTQFILGLVFVETLILFTLLICFMLIGKM
jgi:F-type H+-transporting ATPase subunit c